MTFQEFIEKHEIDMSEKYAESNPYHEDALPNTMHYVITLSCGDNEIEIPYSCGRMAGYPYLEMVLCTVANEARVSEYDSFEDWADNFGFDSDSRRAERIFENCKEMATMLGGLLTHSQFKEFMECEEE